MTSKVKNAVSRSEEFQALGEVLSGVLNEIYGGEMCFFLLATPANTDKGVSDYISNTRRDDGIEMLTETIQRLKSGETIPEPTHGMQ